jgi:hypothetical protein|nr:MAG TPA: hypothetical protein [Caudoviricetes sp.]
MKLIDLLVQELPKRGGWPEGVDAVEQDSEGQLFEMESDYCSDFKLKKCDDWIADVVTKQQYESALAASQKPAWNGEGLPSVGCECECYVDEGIIHCVVVGYDFDGKAVVMRNVPARKYFSIQANSGRIKPLRTEAERRRDAAIEAMQRESDEGDNWIYSEYEIIYDAIAAGKIPGVKLEG